MAHTCVCRRIDAPQFNIELRGVLSRGASMRGVWLRRSSVRGVSVRGLWLRRSSVRGASMRGVWLRRSSMRGVSGRGVSMCRVSSLPLALGIVRLALARCSTGGFATIGPRHTGDTPTKASYGSKTPHDACGVGVDGRQNRDNVAYRAGWLGDVSLARRVDVFAPLLRRLTGSS